LKTSSGGRNGQNTRNGRTSQSGRTSQNGQSGRSGQSVQDTRGGGGSQSFLVGLQRKLAGHDPDDSAIPAPVRRAVKFMLGGALVTVLAGVFTVIATLADPRLINNGKQPTSSALTGDIVQVVLLTLVYCTLWVLMARMNRSGQVWARIVASVLFAISTYSLYSAINSLHSGEYVAVVNIISFVLAVTEWVCGLGAVALLWRSESSAYFKARAARR
jgi:hypothetical protein